MHARQDQGSPHSGGNAPPWVSSFYSSALSASAAAAANSASASTAGDDDDNDTTTSTGLASSQSDAASTTLKTSIGLDSTTIALSTSSTSMNFPTSVAPGPSISLSPISANPHTWPPSSLTFPNGQSVPTSSVPTQALESLTGTPSSIKTPVASSLSTATEPTALPNDTPSATRDRHAFNGAILAAIIVPIAVLSLFGLALIVCLRRRRRRLAQGVLLRPVAEAKEEAFTKRGPAEVQVQHVQPPQPHLIMSPQNGSYFTGLETMSMMSAEPRASSNEDPPPPYRSRSEATARSPSVRSAFSSVAMPPPALVNLGSPISPLYSMSVAEDSPFNDPPAGVSRVASSRSITSTLYSSNASLAEARPARRGMVRPNVVDVDERSPFADPDPDTDSDDQ